MPDRNPILREYAVFAGRLADAARQETLPRFRARAEVFNKSAADFDPVTEADRKAEQVLRGMIRAAYPEHGILGEEFGAENEAAEWRWVLDPVDGTRAFVCGIASWATLIALERRARPVLGIIDQPFSNERWLGAGGKTLYQRGDSMTACRTSGVVRLDEARVSTTDPRGAVYYFAADEAEAFAAVASDARVVRLGLDAYAYALLALGEIDLVIESNLKRHDFAALIPVIEGAGGVVTDWRGETPGADVRGRIVAAASAELHEAALLRLSKV